MDERQVLLTISSRKAVRCRELMHALGMTAHKLVPILHSLWGAGIIRLNTQADGWDLEEQAQAPQGAIEERT